MGEGREAVPQIGSWDCQYVVLHCKAALGWGLGDIADKDSGITWLREVGGELVRVRPGDGTGVAGSREGPSWVGLDPTAWDC